MRQCLRIPAILACGAWLIAGSGTISSAIPQGEDRRPAVAEAQVPGQRRLPDEPLREDMLRRQAKQRNKERHEALKKETDKLLDLATELKEYVDESSENTLSLDVIKKAEEIEKLAKKVKEKMKGY